MSITAAQVKELRERTGVGMMECKKALQETNGDIEQAIEALRKWGKTKASKKAGRTAAEGAICIKTCPDHKQAIIIEVNSETDFVARDSNFVNFVNQLAERSLAEKKTDFNELNNLPFVAGQAQTVEEARQDLVAKIGENVQIRRIVYSSAVEGLLGTYLHGNRIGVIVDIDTDNSELARDIAMHIAASKPLVIAPEDVPVELIDKEREIYLAQAANSGKPQDIVEKMVEGRLKKYLAEISLLGQPFVKEPDISVGALLAKHRAKVIAFTRFEVGEGIEKEQEDFAEAVLAQAQGGN
jgi:elongation factor Ts